MESHRVISMAFFHESGSITCLIIWFDIVVGGYRDMLSTQLQRVGFVVVGLLLICGCSNSDPDNSTSPSADTNQATAVSESTATVESGSAAELAVASQATSQVVRPDFDPELLGVKPIADSLFAKPLADVTSDAETRFEMVTDSGVEHVNELKREHHLKLVETGSGVAIADYDNDGLPDIYLLSTDGPNRLYKNKGDFQFEDVTAQAGVDGSIDGQDVWGAGASFGDVDNDGDQDLLVCNMGAANLLYLNQGDGTFVESATRAGLSYQGASKVASFCDYDGDGDLDIYLLTNQVRELDGKAKVNLVDGVPTVHPDYQDFYQMIEGRMVHAGERDVLYQNQGNGTFTDVSQAAGIAGHDLGLSVTWLDYNNDGWQDIYVGNDFKTPDHLYQNNGDGTFTDVIASVTHHTPWFSMGADAGDLNNDGHIDMMVADMSGTSHYKQKVNMGDMSDSGWFLVYGAPRQYMRNALFANTGAGRFIDLAFMADLDSTDWTWSVRFADLDNDGLLDIYVTNGHARNSNDSDLANELREKMKTMTKQEIAELGFDIPPLLEKNLVYRNRGDFDFESKGEDWNLDLEGVSNGAAFADLDRDGDLDLVVNNLKEKATVYRNQSGKGNRALVELRGSESNYFGVGAKVEIWHGDGEPMTHQTRAIIPVRGYISSNESIAHFGLGDDSLRKLRITWPNGKVQEFTDIPANQHYVVVEQSAAANHPETENDRQQFADVSSKLNLQYVHQEMEFDDYKREPLLPYQLSQLGPGVAWGDINGDGYPEPFIGGAARFSGIMFVSDAGQRFDVVRGPWIEHQNCEDMGCLFFDFDSDGDEDLYVASGGNEFQVGSKKYRDRIYVNDGTGKFTNAGDDVLPDLTDSASSVAAADFDRDGDLDLFVGSRAIPGQYPLTPQSRLLLNDGGKFRDATSELADELLQSGMVNSGIWSDYDSDGWTDLILALDWGPITVLRNDAGQGFVNVTEEVGLKSHSGWWHGIAAGDLDNDGDLDYVATNNGLNTKYHTDSEHPHRLYYSDFDENGTLDLVEAEYEGSTEYPMRGRSCSSRCMPFIADKFKTFHDFALADLNEIYESEASGVSERPHLTVTMLESAVFWNNGEDGFSVEVLPRMAQSSPGYGVAVLDANSDGNLDILMASNFFGPQPETGFMDGSVGWLLQGDGQRDFSVLWPDQSGVVLPNDSTSLGIADFDLDGDNDALVGVNNAAATLLLNDSQQKHTRIELTGTDGNIQAVGSQIELVSKDDSVRTFELSAGSGYLSQSYPVLSISNSMADELKAIVVRWPDGTKSEHGITIADGVIQISVPAR